MEFERINEYQDERFSQKVLWQHGCFLADGMPYEVEIVSDFEAVIKGSNPGMYLPVIEEFRFYTPQITYFYDTEHRLVKQYARKEIFTVPLDVIQPSQFYVDEEKVRAISHFVQTSEEIIVPVAPFEEGYVSLDGHTRLYYAAMNGWTEVRATEDSVDDYIWEFVKEARKRHVHTPRDLAPISHSEYERKWDQFCDDFFAGRK